MTESPWLPFLYQYSIGGMVFTAGIVIALRKKVLNLSVSDHKKTLFQLILGFLLYGSIHTILILTAGG